MVGPLTEPNVSIVGNTLQTDVRSVSYGNFPSVWVGTLNAVVVCPLLNNSISELAGSKRLGVQLVGTVQSAEPEVGTHV